MPGSYHGSRRVLIAGYALFVFGALSTIVDHLAWLQFSFPRNLGVIIGNGAVMLLGLLAIIIADSLKRLEGRLNRLEEQSVDGENKESRQSGKISP
jgi:hypothetical protein